MSRSPDKNLELLGSALRRVPDYIGDVCDEDLDHLDGWLADAVKAVHAEQLTRTRPGRPGEAGEGWRCTRCGLPKWVSASLTGPVSHGGRAIKQCVPCGHYSNDPATGETETP